MEATENWEGNDRTIAANSRTWTRFAFWNPLIDALMRPRAIEIRRVLLEDTSQVRFVHEQNVIEAFTPHTPQKAFTDRVRSWSPDRCPQHLNPAACRHRGEVWTKPVAHTRRVSVAVARR